MKILFHKWPENHGCAWTVFTMSDWAGCPDAAVHTVTEWCINQFGLPGDPQLPPDGQRWIHRDETFIFTRSDDAVAFRIRWC